MNLAALFFRTERRMWSLLPDGCTNRLPREVVGGICFYGSRRRFARVAFHIMCMRVGPIFLLETTCARALKARSAECRGISPHTGICPLTLCAVVTSHFFTKYRGPFLRSIIDQPVLVE